MSNWNSIHMQSRLSGWKAAFRPTCLPAGGGSVRHRRSTVERNPFKTAAVSLLLLLLFFCKSLVVRVQFPPLLPADEHCRCMLKRSANRPKWGRWHYGTRFLEWGLKKTKQIIKRHEPYCGAIAASVKQTGSSRTSLEILSQSFKPTKTHPQLHKIKPYFLTLCILQRRNET